MAAASLIHHNTSNEEMRQFSNRSEPLLLLICKSNISLYGLKATACHYFCRQCCYVGSLEVIGFYMQPLSFYPDVGSV